MDEPFDAYFKWLGIPPEEQPPNHYRLLGIDPFESEADVIRRAAANRVTSFRVLLTGKHGVLAEEVLRRVAEAKACLLDPDKKAGYDRKLRNRLGPMPAAAEPGLDAPAAIDAGQASRDFQSPGAGTRAKQVLRCLIAAAVGFVVGFSSMFLLLLLINR
jgi:hypothetical protein